MLSFIYFSLKAHRRALIFVMFTWQVVSLHILPIQPWLVWLRNFAVLQGINCHRQRRGIVSSTAGFVLHGDKVLEPTWYSSWKSEFWHPLNELTSSHCPPVSWFHSCSCQVCSELVLYRVGTDFFFVKTKSSFTS